MLPVMPAPTPSRESTRPLSTKVFQSSTRFRTNMLSAITANALPKAIRCQASYGMEFWTNCAPLSLAAKGTPSYRVLIDVWMLKLGSVPVRCRLSVLHVIINGLNLPWSGIGSSLCSTNRPRICGWRSYTWTRPHRRRACLMQAIGAVPSIRTTAFDQSMSSPRPTKQITIGHSISGEIKFATTPTFHA